MSTAEPSRQPGPQANDLGQVVGFDVPGWSGCPPPTRAPLEGRWCRLEPLDVAAHARPLYDALAEETDARGWTYLPYGPFASFDEFRAWMESTCFTEDVLFFAILDRDSNRTAGLAAYLRIAPALGSIEVGHIRYAPALQRSRAGTEAMYLMMKHAFELGFRRYEWKCDSLNAASWRAAQRYGFRFEGIFRQSLVYKGRNRDTTWLSITDSEWPRVRARFEDWLSETNFDEAGEQRTRLGLSTTTDGGLAFREAHVGDVPAIVAMLADDPLGREREDVSDPPSACYLEAFAEIAADPRNELWLAVDGAEVLGTLQLTFLPGLSHRGGERAQIESVRVAAPHRSRGIGRQLFEFAIGRARERGCRMVQLTSDVQRQDALRFYESLGFRPTHAGMKLPLG